MHRGLQRQLKRVLGVADESELASLLAACRVAVEQGGLPTPVLELLAGFGDFVERVDATYAQSDRDLDLRTRSLELSSNELSEANDRLREDLAARGRAIDALRETVSRLLAKGVEIDESRDGDSLEFLSRLIGEMVGERELQRLKLDNLKFALDQHAIVSITDVNGTITYANEKFCQISGYFPEELIGSNHRIVRSAVHDEAFFTHLWQTISSGKVWHGEICNCAKDGTLYWVAASIVPLLDNTGLPQEYIAIRTDISARKASEALLAQARDAAEAGSRAKSDFLANMSHEIRTPMNGIIGMTDLALDTKLDAEQREYMGVVKSSAESLLTIINDILDFSKIEAGQLDVEQIAFDLRRSLVEGIRTLIPRAHERGLEIVTDLNDDVPARVIGDPGRIRQILLNLVGNAIKFTQRGSIVVTVTTMAAKGDGCRIRISVRDTGIGIPLAKQALVFESFTQADTSTTRRYGGTGLGLTISRQLVELMGGHIGVSSEPGVGSEFNFELPLRLDLESSSEDVRPRVQLAGRSALIVDDHPINREIFVRSMNKWAMRSIALATPGEVQEWVEYNPAPDLILLDVQMPGMDGFELATWLRQHPRVARVPIIVLSSSGNRGDGQRCRDLGLDGYFAKPVAEEDLHEAIARVLGGQPTSGAVNATPLMTGHQLAEERVALSILLVEDHPVNQQLAMRLLEKWGHTVVLAQNGAEALDQLERRMACRDTRFDVCLMDMQMPVMGGLEATRQWREREAARGLNADAELTIIAMTANAMQGDREACLEAGMNDYLAKPIKANVLQAKLNSLGGARRHEGDSAVSVGADAEQQGDADVDAFDYAAAVRTTDPEIAEILVPAFLGQVDQDMNDLSRLLAAGDSEALMRLAHAVKGTAAAFAADPVVEYGQMLEHLAREGTLGDANAVLKSLTREIERLKLALIAAFPG